MKTNPNDSASGLTKREYFAALAMQGLLANGLPVSGSDGNLTRHPEDIAAHSIRYADALITELNKAK